MRRANFSFWAAMAFTYRKQEDAPPGASDTTTKKQRPPRKTVLAAKTYSPNATKRKQKLTLIFEPARPPSRVNIPARKKLPVASATALRIILALARRVCGLFFWV